MTPVVSRLLLIGLVAQCGACTSITDSIRNASDGRRGAIPQSLLGAVPCVTRASEIAFQVPVENSNAYSTTLSTNSVRYIGPAHELVLYPAGKPPSGAKPTERVRFSFWPSQADNTEVRYIVDAAGDRRQVLEQLAIGALEQCGATLR